MSYSQFFTVILHYIYIYYYTHIYCCVCVFLKVNVWKAAKFKNGTSTEITNIVTLMLTRRPELAIVVSWPQSGENLVSRYELAFSKK